MSKSYPENLPPSYCAGAVTSTAAPINRVKQLWQPATVLERLQTQCFFKEDKGVSCNSRDFFAACKLASQLLHWCCHLHCHPYKQGKVVAAAGYCTCAIADMAPLQRGQRVLQ